MSLLLSVWIGAFIPDCPDFGFTVEADSLLGAAYEGLRSLGLSRACAVSVQPVGQDTGVLYADLSL